MKPSWDITVNRDPEAIHVAITGAVDASAAEQLKAKLSALCDGPRPRILINCSGLTYINSMTMGQFSAFSKRCKANGGGFALYGVEGRILDVMKLIHLHELMPICRTLDEAIKALGR